MDHQISRSAPQHIIKALDDSLRDIAEGNIHDAQAVQAEARRMIAERDRPQPSAPRGSLRKPARQTRTA